MTISDLLDTGQHNLGKRPRRKTEPSIALLGDDIYVVLADNDTLGFVERVGTVYVALSGPDLSRAVEVGQTLLWDTAVQMVWGQHH